MKTFSWKLNLLFLLTMSCFWSCQKDDEEMMEDTTDDMMIVENLDLFPLSEGSWWEYEETPFLGDVFTYTRTVTDETKTFDGKPYKILAADLEGIDDQHVYCEDGDCFDAGESFVYDGGTFNLPFLKKDMSVGDTWTYEYTSGGGNPNRYIYEVVAVNEARIVKDVEYTGVTTIRRDFTAVEAGSWSEPVELELQYFADGIGLIEAYSSYFEAGRVLLDYEIK